MASGGKTVELVKLVLIAVAVFFSIAAFCMFALKREEGSPSTPSGTAQTGGRQRLTLAQKEQQVDEQLLAREQAERRIKEMEEWERKDLAQRNEIWARVKRELDAKFAPDGEYPAEIELATPRTIQQFTPPQPGEESPPPVAPLPPPVKVFVKEKRIEFEAKTCIVGGSTPLEVLLADPGGRVHESLLVTEVNPYDIWQGLLLVGLEMCYGPRAHWDDRPLDGDRVLVFVEWVDKENKTVRVYAEDLIYNMDTNKSMDRTGWLFTGSHFVINPETGKEELIAVHRGNIGVTWRRPEAIIDNPTPDGANPELYKAYEGRVPERGTTVKVIMTPHEKFNAARRERK